MLIYLDSCIVIYPIEQPPGFGPRAAARVGILLAAGDTLVVSDLTRLECRCNPSARAIPPPWGITTCSSPPPSARP